MSRPYHATPSSLATLATLAAWLRAVKRAKQAKEGRAIMLALWRQVAESDRRTMI